MNIGIITYVAKDNSHGYLLKLDNLEEKYVHDILNQNEIRRPPKPQIDFVKYWTDTAKQRGYTYLIEFSGYGITN